MMKLLSLINNCLMKILSEGDDEESNEENDEESNEENDEESNE